MSQSNKSTNSSRMGVILEASRIFLMGDREFIFDENEAIFFMDKPKSSNEYHNTPEGCNSCEAKWNKVSDLKDSHCDFCGISNCKKCLKKTRKFIETTARVSLTNRPTRSSLSAAEMEGRGKICKLCNRKFHIKAMV